MKLVMASNEHKELATYVKEVHLSLRKQTSALGVDAAWKEHCKDEDVLRKYAKSMEKLATTYWNKNSSEENGVNVSRINWAVDVIINYFHNKSYLTYREREIVIGNKINLTLNCNQSFPQQIKLLDVGSCYNPFRIFEFFDVLAIDLYPANETVYKCDFLNVAIDTDNIVKNSKVEQLKEGSFDVVTFCFLLEYLPNSELRIQACKNAYKLLKVEGILIVSTPDSKHVGANSNIMKCWRYTLACIGFCRIKYEKFQHMHCMTFRKSLHLNVASRWAALHREPYMRFDINIPQDYSSEKETMSSSTDIPNVCLLDDFMELPFYNLN